MSDFKRKLDQMMGDTSTQERRIKQRVHENLRAPVKKPSWQVPFVTAGIAVIALFLFITFNPIEQLSSNEGPGTPYDPLDDLAQISALQKRSSYQQLIMSNLESFHILSRSMDCIM